MYFYIAYGLNVCSELELPELMSRAELHSRAPDEVTFRFGPVRMRPTELNTDRVGFWATPDEACHVVEKVGSFLVRGGREVIVDPAPNVEERLLRLSLLGPAMSLLLHQRGILVLHASVVAQRGAAVAFLGNNGWGKSTIAAALYRKGWEVVADDVAAIRTAPVPTVLPGCTQLKLWPEAVALLGEPPEALPLLHPDFDKRGWHARRGFSGNPRQLVRIYVLDAGPTPAVEPLDRREACFELIHHWYGNRFGSALLHATRSAATHLSQCAALASRVPVHRLRRSGGSRTLFELADFVHEDLTPVLNTSGFTLSSRSQERPAGQAATQSSPR